MKTLFKHIAISFAFLITASCGDSGTNSSVSANVKKIVAIGDSIGAGWAGTNPWPRLVQEKTGIPIINQSIPGSQAAQSVSRTIKLIDAEKPSHLIIMLGTNDANNGSVSAAISAMRKIIAETRARGVIPIVGTLPPAPRSAVVTARASQISSGYRSLGAGIAEVEGAFGSQQGLFIDDQFHPNNAGQDIIANAFVSALK